MAEFGWRRWKCERRKTIAKMKPLIRIKAKWRNILGKKCNVDMAVIFYEKT